MAEWAFNIAVNEYSCPKCHAEKTFVCRTPSGTKAKYPHKERVGQLTEKDWNRCKGQAFTFDQMINQNS